MKIFVDANVLIDLIDEKREFHSQAISFFQNNLENVFYTSCDILTTVYYITSKIKNPLLDLENLLKFVKIISFSNEEAQKAIELMKNNSNFKDFEDTLQYILAKKINADLIVTNDKKFHSPDIEILNLNTSPKSQPS